jgi:hypothetical protein
MDRAAVRFWEQPRCDKVHDRAGNRLSETPCVLWGLAIRSAANKTLGQDVKKPSRLVK